MNKDIVVIKFVSSDESKKFNLTLKEKSIVFDDFRRLDTCNQCDKKSTCKSYTIPDVTHEYEFEDNCDIFEEIAFFLDTHFNRSVAIVLGFIMHGILVNEPKDTVTFTFNDDLILLSYSLDQLDQQMIS